MFSSTTTELSINREKASASPPSTMELMLAPIRFRMRNAASAESGMDSITATVARHAAKKDEDHRRRQHQADAALAAQIADGCLHKDGLIEDHAW
jgi:hypothetical protein